MPRIKAPPAVPSTSLEGFTVTFASYSASGHSDFASKTVTQLKAEIANCGGSYASKLDQCTHLVASPAQFEKKLKAVKEALQQPDVTIVDYDWLAASLKSTSPVVVDNYLLDQSSATTNVLNGINGVSGVNGSNGADVDSDSDSKASDAKQKPNLKRKRGNDKALNKQQPTAVSTQKPPAKSKSVLRVPVDEHLAKGDTFTVFVDDNGLAWDATLNQSNSNANNNKFYKLQVLVDHRDSYWCWTRWGRVGERGQSKMLGNGDLKTAMSEFEKKFKDKNGNTWANRDGPSKSGKYVFIEINYAESESESEDEDEDKPQKKKAAIKDEGQEEDEDIDDIPIESTLDKPVQELMELIFDLKLFDSTMAALNYDAKKMPLGKLSKKTLLKGYEVLKELASLIADPTMAVGIGTSYGQAIQDRSNLYFSLVPHVSGRNRLPTLDNMDLIKVRREKIFVFWVH